MQRVRLLGKCEFPIAAGRTQPGITNKATNAHEIHENPSSPPSLPIRKGEGGRKEVIAFE